MNEAFVAVGELLEAYEKFPKAVVPGMCCFDDPAPVLRRSAGTTLLPSNAWGVAMLPDRLLGRFSVVATISVQEGTDLGRRWLEDASVKDGAKLGDVIAICSGHDQRQRDATPVYQQMPLGPF